MDFFLCLGYALCPDLNLSLPYVIVRQGIGRLASGWGRREIVIVLLAGGKDYGLPKGCEKQGAGEGGGHGLLVFEVVLAMILIYRLFGGTGCGLLQCNVSVR